MYTLLIVDDEEFVRSAMSTMIDWATLGFTTVLEAEDGEEAYEIIKEKQVDILLTDISMPFMDGIELCRLVSENHPEIHAVVLSGYDDFQYAQKAIRYGVRDYILKPIGAETLYNKMEEILIKYKKEIASKNYIKETKSQLYRIMPQLREKALYSVICNGTMNQREIQRIESLNIQLNHHAYEVVVLEPIWEEVQAGDLELFTFAVKNIVSETIGEGHYVFGNDTNSIIILFCFDEETEYGGHIINEEIIKISEIVYDTINIEVTCALGSIVNEWEHLNQSYEDAMKALECKYSLGKKTIYNITDLTYIENTFYYPKEQLKELIYSVKYQDELEIEAAFEAIKRACYIEKKISKENLKMIGIEMITSMLKELSNIKDVDIQIWEKGFELYRKIETIDEFDKMLDVLHLYACKVSTELRTVKNSSSEKIINGIQDYVNANYMEESTTLITVAEHLGISTGYLCAIYKKETNQSFIKYLTDIRIQHAMELLQTTDKKSYEIADETGFNNAHYFSTVFKKSVGMTPSEYREKKG